jgi:dTDP-4-dehydrorhamnose 3,5-epimerase
MNVIKTDIDGVFVIKPTIFEDSRGYFFESYSQKKFEEKIGKINFVQDNESKSSYGVIRGLHFQRPPYAQAKLVRCVKGSVLDVAVDIREGSPTYGKHVAVELTEDNHKQLFIPRGFAHGFSVLSDEAVFQYKCDEFFHPEAADGISVLDKSLGIDWKVYDNIKVLDRDIKGFSFNEFKTPFLALGMW